MKRCLLLLSLLVQSVLFGQLVINEGSNRNYLAFPDEDSEFPDWIEIYNSGTDTISLAGYSLTDDATVPQKWTFPPISIPPSEYLPVFCSGKDRKPIADFTPVLYQTNYNPTVGWNTHNFTTPFYWDGVSNLLINVCSYDGAGYTVNSVVRQSATSFPSTIFAVLDGSDGACSMAAGNVVYQRPNMRLNGVTIGTGNIQNGATDYPAPYGNWYWSARHQMLILASELTAAGLSAGNINSLAFNVVSTDPNMNYDYLDVMIKPVTNSTLSNVFETLNPNLNQHSNFSISTSGETIYLINPAQSIQSSLFVNCQDLDVSRGRFPDASATLMLFDDPTPDSTNNNSTPFSSYLMAPTFSVNSGIFSAPINVGITHANGLGSVVHYTLDGSDPTTASPSYSGNPIPLFYSTVLKARVFAPGILPSPIVSASYLFGIDHVTPIISVTTQNNNLYGPTGIFDNWMFDWQRAAHVDYFTSDNQLVFSQNAGMQVDGGWGGSRYHPQHSFRLELDNGVLGEGSINHLVIPNRPNRTKYSRFYLRNGSNQYLIYPYKDAVQVEMMAGTAKSYHSAWRPVSVYINGGYFGLYELREKFDPEYFKIHDGADADSVDILSLSAWNNFYLRKVHGRGAAVDTFFTYYNAFNSLNPANSNFWDQADQYFDMEWYNDYIMGEAWMGNVDWPGNNIKIMRSDATNFRYRFCTIDLELSMAPNGWTDCYHDQIGYMLGQSTDLPYINIWLKGMQNNRFHDYFINRFADLMNTEYKIDRLLDIEQSFFDQTVVEMQNEYARWGDPNNVPGQMNDFYNRHLVFREQLSERTPQVRNHIQSNFNLPNKVDLTLDVHPAGAGKIHISTIEPDTYPWEGVYFNGVPIRIEAIANPGYQFTNWGNNALVADVLNPVFLDTLDVNNIQFDAYFEVYDLNVLEESQNHLFALYPNPANELITLVNGVKDAENMTYEITDLTGRSISTGSLNKTGSHTEINLNGFNASVYLVNIYQNGERIAKKRFVCF
jgi:hypothetical protein